MIKNTKICSIYSLAKNEGFRTIITLVIITYLH